MTKKAFITLCALGIFFVTAILLQGCKEKSADAGATIENHNNHGNHSETTTNLASK